jgi:translocation and assembly module TamB
VRGAALQTQPLSGRVDVNLTNLAFIQGFVPDIDNPGGTLTAGYNLAGTVGAPRLQGEARLANARADIPRLGIELRDLRLAAIGDGSGSLTLDGAARSGPGTVSITGRAGLVPSAETPVKLAIKGQRFQAMDTEEIDVLVSPDLAVDYTGQLVRLTGDVVIPQADIVIEDRREKGPVGVSEDVVFVNATEEPDARKDLAVVTQVRLVLGRDIDINVYGLKGKPTGSLLVRDEPGRVTRGTGELEIKEGIFKAYGQDLTIERGRIVFAGPIDNPGIDVRAFRKAEDGTIAGINAKGTVKKPEVTLWSQPTLPESEALAYLLLGRPLNQTQPQEGDRLANAATSLGLKGGNLLAKKLAARWGLEEARIEAKDNDLDQASLVVGKYLSPRLYVAYGIGLFEAVNTFRIRYLMNDKWTLQAESGEGTSADVLYTIER